jgi:hypothetical protein
MALTVAYLSSYPQFGPAPTQTYAATYTFTNGLYTQSGTQYVAGYLDGENRAKFFYTDGATIALPKLVTITQISQVDSAGTTKTGDFVVTLSYTAGSPDATSANSQIFLDAQGLLILAAGQYG